MEREEKKGVTEEVISTAQCRVFRFVSIGAGTFRVWSVLARDPDANFVGASPHIFFVCTFGHDVYERAWLGDLPRCRDADERGHDAVCVQRLSTRWRYPENDDARRTFQLMFFNLQPLQQMRHDSTIAACEREF